MYIVYGRAKFSKLVGALQALEALFYFPVPENQIGTFPNANTMEDTIKKKGNSLLAAIGILFNKFIFPNKQFSRIKRENAFNTFALMNIMKQCDRSHTDVVEVVQVKLS